VAEPAEMLALCVGKSHRERGVADDGA
jgi:hypothetical protein